MYLGNRKARQTGAMQQDLTPQPPQCMEEVISGCAQRLLMVLFFSSSEPDATRVRVAAFWDGDKKYSQQNYYHQNFKRRFQSAFVLYNSPSYSSPIPPSTGVCSARSRASLHGPMQNPALGPGTHVTLPQSSLQKGVYAAAE